MFVIWKLVAADVSCFWTWFYSFIHSFIYIDKRSYRAIHYHKTCLLDVRALFVTHIFFVNQRFSSVIKRHKQKEKNNKKKKLTIQLMTIFFLFVLLLGFLRSSSRPDFTLFTFFIHLTLKLIFICVFFSLVVTYTHNNSIWIDWWMYFSFVCVFAVP